VHPTQLYESLVGLALFAAALVLFPRRRFAGEVFLALAFGYGACRFGLELFRDDAERGLFGPAAPGALWVGVAVALAGLALLVGLAMSRGRLAAGAALVVAVGAAAAWLARFTAFGREPAIALSTSQWLGLATMLAAAIVARRARAPRTRSLQPALGSSN
jgi:hypothetical protein